VPRWLSAAQPIAIVGIGGGTKIVPSTCPKGKTSTVFHGYSRLLTATHGCSRSREVTAPDGVHGHAVEQERRLVERADVTGELDLSYRQAPATVVP